MSSTVEGFGPTTALAYQGTLAFLDLIDSAAALEASGHAALAVVLYDTWLAHTQSPNTHVVVFNLATTLVKLGELVRAEEAYLQAIAQTPSGLCFSHPHLNLGLLYEQLGRTEQAINEWIWIDQNAPREAASLPIVLLALNHLGRVSEATKNFALASDFLARSLALDPNQPDAVHHWIFLRQRQCVWPVVSDFPGLPQDVQWRCASVLAMLSLTDDPAMQQSAAAAFVDRRFAKNLPRLAPRKGYGHSKIRIAYCSSDFCLHPVALLAVELFELHDRSKFEVYGFCWSPQDGSALRQRVISAMDHFFMIRGLNDEEAAQLIRSHEIDVVVDLQGQTAGARSGIFAYRCAPIQVGYLGLPATSAQPEIDYVIADAFLIPPEQARFYTEKPLYMPDVYQVSDRHRVVAQRPSRESCGLPQAGFVFCAFSNSLKITPAVFDVWLRLLLRVPSSVLWLLADNPWAQENLKAYARQRGIGPERLVFVQRAAPDVYLARYGLADLFLDTFPFNAGATANDCLWMGCPLVTLSGRSFASRMAGALLTAAGLPELITYSLTQYEALAVALANQPETCTRLRARLAQVKQTGVLFDTPKFVAALESRLTEVLQNLDPITPACS